MYVRDENKGYAPANSGTRRRGEGGLRADCHINQKISVT